MSTEPRYYVHYVGGTRGRTPEPAVMDRRGGTVKHYLLGEDDLAQQHADRLNQESNS